MKQSTSQDNESNAVASGEKEPDVGVCNVGIELTETFSQPTVEEETEYASVDDPPLPEQNGYKGLNVAEMKQENEYQELNQTH